MSANPQNIATIQLLPVRFLIEGPPELIALTQQAQYAATPEEAKYAVMDVWSNWYVQCSVSGEWVSLDKLYYWDVDKNQIYARPAVIPGNALKETP